MSSVGFRRLPAGVVACLLAGLTACTFSRSTMIKSNPDGAEIHRKAQVKGVTPAAVKLPCSGSDNKVELRKPGYRPMSVVLEGSWKWNNIVFGGLLGALAWGKCPANEYGPYTLEKATASLEGKATLIVSQVPAGLEVHVGDSPLVPGERLVLEGGTHTVTVYDGDRVVNSGRLELAADNDYVTELQFQER